MILCKYVLRYAVFHFRLQNPTYYPVPNPTVQYRIEALLCNFEQKVPLQMLILRDFPYFASYYFLAHF